MEAEATFCASVLQSDLVPVAVATTSTELPACAAKQLTPAQRQDLAVQILAGIQPVSELAQEHQVSRKFLYQQASTAEEALQEAFCPATPEDKVFFYLPVTKAWLHQLVLTLVLICHSSYRGVVALLRDLFDWKIALGTVHNIVDGAVAKATAINSDYNLSRVRIGLHDEIFQAGKPVLVGVDAESTFCYLLSLEEHRDAETWGVRLLELTPRGLAPDATIADGGTALRAGQKMAMPDVPCWGDLFHLSQDAHEVIRFLENRAYDAIEACDRLERERARLQRQGQPLHRVGQQLRRAHSECDSVVQLYDDIKLLLDWLQRDILAVAGPAYADRRELYDFVLGELKARVHLCSHRLQPLYRVLKNQRDNFLAFAHELDKRLDLLGNRFGVSPDRLRHLLLTLSRDERDPRRWTEESALRAEFRDRFWEIQEAIVALAESTVRASSLVENLNSRLRGYFFLRRHLGERYLSLLQFFLNHRVFDRSDRPEREGKTPAELLTGRPHRHWLELLGYTRFQRS